MAQDETSLPEPRHIGPYKLIDVLGEGGMGVVYLADQSAPVRRRVALKILKPGMDTKQVLARFESERQALAVMDHPNIARALDGGMTEDGRPYFVMELVHGTPITQYADTHRLSTRERLRLFIDVCRAVQHAHQKGVIHRDLKPSNVLVTAHESGPVVKVIDFGIAKAIGLGLTDRTLVTRAGQMLGTPEYMSPEQAEMSGLDVDTRTDIYSLGVMLYELIVGVLPFDLGAKPDYAIPHTLREREAPRPSVRLTGLGQTLPTVARYRRTTPEALRRDLRGDLDWIILKAMDKDRTRRYDTPTGLAMDIERHLRDEPVLARPPSTKDRMIKFARRNRAAVAPAAVAILALLVGSTAAFMGHRRALAEQARAQQEAATAQQVVDFLIDLFQVSDPGEARGSTITAREVLDRGAARFRSELVDQPAVQARLLSTVGAVFHNLGLYDDAAGLLNDAVITAERIGGEGSPVLAEALWRLGMTRRQQGRTAEAEAALRRALALNVEAGRKDHGQYARAAASLGAVYIGLGRYDEAEAILKEAQATQERLLGPDHPELAYTLINIAGVYLRRRDLTSAEPYLHRVIAITEQANGPDHPLLGAAWNNLGTLYYWRGDYEAAESAYTRGLAINETVLGPDHDRVATGLHNLGEIQLLRGNHRGAESRLRRALEIKERVFGNSHPSVAQTLKGLADVYKDEGRFSDAAPLYRRALAIFDQSMDRPDSAVREAMEAYASLLRMTGRPLEADSLELRASRIAGPDDGG
jgi:eukaryotic-like serine/threonine-protein kinase